MQNRADKEKIRELVSTNPLSENASFVPAYNNLEF